MSAVALAVDRPSRLRRRGIAMMMGGYALWMLAPVLAFWWSMKAADHSVFLARNEVWQPIGMAFAAAGFVLLLAGLYIWDRGRRAAGALIKIRCRSCGYLERENARFCSGCGQEV